mgnify:CR=1 FL=1
MITKAGAYSAVIQSSDDASLKGRVTNKEGTVTVDHHSTHVAGTLIGSSFYPGLMGMAPFAGLLAYDFTNDAAEMTAEVTSADRGEAGEGVEVEAAERADVLNWLCGWLGAWQLRRARTPVET